MSKHWLARAMIAMWACDIGVFQAFDANEDACQFLQARPVLGAILVGIVAAMAVLLLADVVVNDMLPARYHFNVKDHRHLTLMAMAMTLVVLGGMVAAKAGQAMVLVTYLLPAAFAVLVTWIDIFARHGVRK